MNAHPDRMMLRRYDPATRTWSLSKAGEFWGAVQSSRELGRYGEGATVAILDDGFDLGIPALAEHTLHRPEWNKPEAFHGSVVALLVLEVAPKAELHLFPAGSDEFLDEARIVAALDDVRRLAPDVLNLSLGLASPLPAIGLDAVGQALAADDWRVLAPPPQDAIARAVRAILQETSTVVVVAAGNAGSKLFSPASTRGVFAIGFRTDERHTTAEGVSLASAQRPTFTQSLLSDFSVRQPKHTAGSSFATALVSGFAALAGSRDEWEAYRQAVVHSSTAAYFQREADPRDPAPDYDFAQQHYAIARQKLPAGHRHVGPSAPCPSCQLFAADISINHGMLALMSGDLDLAEQLLVPVESFAPENADAAANLGMLRAVRADGEVKAGRMDAASTLLESAAGLMEKASRLRQPPHEPFVRRAEEFRVASADPASWTFHP